ncbi:MAG: DUF2125 domain-containing protein [Devosia sp.]|nr:DUF2125 domain-containing protein [Devosia sp.]
MRRITILAIVLVIIVGGWSAAWLYASKLIRDNVAQLADADGQTTPKLVCDRLDIGGYPFWFDVSCGNLTVTQGDLSANVPEVRASLLVYDPFHVVGIATGPLSYADAFTGSKRRLDWKTLEASARLTGWRIARISIVADSPVLTNTIGGDVLIGKASHAELHLLDIPEQYDAAKGMAGLALYAKTDDINAPGIQINDGMSTLEADISGLSDDIRTYGDLNAIRRWQVAGGKIKLVGLKGSDGAQDVGVVGTLGLDDKMRPEGQLTVDSKGLVERVSGMVPEQWRPIIIGNPGPDGSYHEVLNFTNGLAFSGVVPLGAVPPLLP